MSSPRVACARFAILCSFVMASACTSTSASEEPQALVLNVEQAPEWVKAGTTVEVLDDHDAVLLVSALEAPPPVLLDVSAPSNVHHLKVRLKHEGHEAQGAADVKEGYATCSLR